MIATSKRVKKKGVGPVWGCLVPFVGTVIALVFFSYLVTQFNIGEGAALGYIGIVVAGLMVVGLLSMGPKDLLSTTLVLLGLMAACFLLCTVLYRLNNPGVTTFGDLLSHWPV